MSQLGHTDLAHRQSLCIAQTTKRSRIGLRLLPPLQPTHQYQTNDANRYQNRSEPGCVETRLMI